MAKKNYGSFDSLNLFFSWYSMEAVQEIYIEKSCVRIKKALDRLIKVMNNLKDKKVKVKDDESLNEFDETITKVFDILNYEVITETTSLYQSIQLVTDQLYMETSRKKEEADSSKVKYTLNKLKDETEISDIHLNPEVLKKYKK